MSNSRKQEDRSALDRTGDQAGHDPTLAEDEEHEHRMSAMVVTVMNNGQFVVKVLIALNTCSTMVCLLVDEMYTLGVMKSFHVPMVWNTMTVVRIGRISGSTIVQKMRNGPAPSIRAAR